MIMRTPTRRRLMVITLSPTGVRSIQSPSGRKFLRYTKLKK
uniref:Uncharacterized protein n=1 Tax=Brassica oleracea TaxID=3712 RepID=A0A3P6AMG4_BRAOL|nr:unnamed protein product [Brassica oleracea]